jgi:hypothetical protein
MKKCLPMRRRRVNPNRVGSALGVRPRLSVSSRTLQLADVVELVDTQDLKS